MTWIYYTLISIFFFSLLGLSQRVVATKSKFPRAASFVFNSLATIFTLIFLIISGDLKTINLNTSIYAWGIALIASFFYALFERSRFRVYKYLDASDASIIGNISIVISIIGALFLYHEILSLPKIVGSLLILLALFIISQSKSKSSHLTIHGLLFGVLIFSFLGIASMLDKAGTIYFNSGTYSLIVWVVPTIMVYFPYIKSSEIKTEFKIGNWKIALAALLNALGYIYILKAFEIAEATKVLPLAQISTFFTVILAALFLREKDNLPRKIICAIIAILGSVLLVIS